MKPPLHNGRCNALLQRREEAALGHLREGMKKPATRIIGRPWQWQGPAGPVASAWFGRTQPRTGIALNAPAAKPAGWQGSACEII